MRIKLDENLPAERADDLAALGHDVDTVVSEGLAGAPDPVMGRHAAREHRILFTLDKDFGDTRRFPPSEGAGVVLFRQSHRGRSSTRAAVLRSLPALPGPAELFGKLTVVTATGVRTRR